MTVAPGPPDPPHPRNGADRTGLDLARQALAAARAEARRLGLRAGAGRPDRPAASGAAGAEDDGVARRRVRPVEHSGAHPDERDPQLLGPTMERLLVDRGWETDAAVGGVMGRWAGIVGAALAAHAQPVSFADGELVVQADSTAWATQLRLLAPTLLARLASELGAGTVTTVAVRGPSAPSWKRGRLRVRGRGPRDTYG